MELIEYKNLVSLDQHMQPLLAGQQTENYIRLSNIQTNETDANDNINMHKY